MLVALTGTPGTGKTTVAALLPYRVIDLNSLVREEGLASGTDTDRGCIEADMDALADRIANLVAAPADAQEIVVLEGHYSHMLADRAIVLRLNPHELRIRLEARGYAEKKVRENVEAEVLDVILVEAVEHCRSVSEIDTTSKSPEEVARQVVGVVSGEADLLPGQVSWMEGYEFDLG